MRIILPFGIEPEEILSRRRRDLRLRANPQIAVGLTEQRCGEVRLQIPKARLVVPPVGQLQTGVVTDDNRPFCSEQLQWQRPLVRLGCRVKNLAPPGKLIGQRVREDRSRRLNFGRRRDFGQKSRSGNRTRLRFGDHDALVQLSIDLSRLEAQGSHSAGSIYERRMTWLVRPGQYWRMP